MQWETLWNTSPVWEGSLGRAGSREMGVIAEGHMQNL